MSHLKPRATFLKSTHYIHGEHFPPYIRSLKKSGYQLYPTKEKKPEFRLVTESSDIQLPKRPNIIIQHFSGTLQNYGRQLTTSSTAP